MMKHAWIVLVLLSSTVVLADNKKPPPKKEATEEAKDAVRNYLAEAKVNSLLRMALLKSFKSDGLRVKVEVNGNTVTLSGEVEERATQKLAAEVAKSVEGVRYVKNTLTLAKTAPHQDNFEGKVHDTMLESNVKVHLLQDVGEVALKIEVEAADDTVSLRGAVPDVATRDRLLQSAAKVEGVKNVTDLLKPPG